MGDAVGGDGGAVEGDLKPRAPGCAQHRVLAVRSGEYCFAGPDGSGGMEVGLVLLTVRAERQSPSRVGKS